LKALGKNLRIFSAAQRGTEHRVAGSRNIGCAARIRAVSWLHSIACDDNPEPRTLHSKIHDPDMHLKHSGVDCQDRRSGAWRQHGWETCGDAERACACVPNRRRQAAVAGDCTANRAPPQAADTHEYTVAAGRFEASPCFNTSCCRLLCRFGFEISGFFW